MSDEITTAMVDTYNDGIELLAQQTRSKLIEYVRTEAESGERNSFDQVAPVAARRRDDRHGDTQYIHSPHRRRWVTTENWYVSDLLDEPDMRRILNNPSGEYSANFIAALNRERDAEIIEKAIGTAYTGKTGTTQVAFPAGYQIAHGGTGFTLAKVQAAMTLLKGGNAVDQNMMDLYVAWTSAQEEEFMDTTEVKSHDYNTQRVLVRGAMDTFYGFNYVRLEDWTDEEGTLHRILPKSGTVRTCVAWVKNGLLMNEPKQPQVRVAQLPGKHYSWQFYGDADFGATRMQETHVVQIDVQEP